MRHGYHELLKQIRFEESNPIGTFKAAQEHLRKVCSRSGQYYPLASGVERESPAFKAYCEVATWLDEQNQPILTEDLYLGWWNDFSVYQTENKKYVKKAGIAINFAAHHWHFKDKASAFRWAVYTQADDILGEHNERGGVGKTYLQSNFGLSGADIDRLNTIADKCRESASSAEDGWAQPAGFSEEVARIFFEEDPTPLMRWSSDRREFPLSSSYFNALLNRANSVESADKKGKALEDLASYLLSLLPGCIPRRNLKDLQLAGESDLVVNNLTRVADVTVDLLGRDLLVECKNWAEPVGVPQVGYFLHRMRLHHVRFGIIFSKNGITGERKRNAAHELIRRTYHENGSLCVVIDNSDLKNLANRERPSFWALLLTKIEEFRFGK